MHELIGKKIHKILLNANHECDTLTFLTNEGPVGLESDLRFSKLLNVKNCFNKTVHGTITTESGEVALTHSGKILLKVYFTGSQPEYSSRLKGKAGPDWYANIVEDFEYAGVIIPE